MLRPPLPHVNPRASLVRREYNHLLFIERFQIIIAHVRVFPSTDALLRLVSAVLVEIDEAWAASTQPDIKWKPDTASTA